MVAALGIDIPLNRNPISSEPLVLPSLSPNSRSELPKSIFPGEFPVMPSSASSAPLLIAEVTVPELTSLLTTLMINSLLLFSDYP